MCERYEVVVGLEVHAELSTASKLLCGCENAFGAAPNTLCCPVCTGMPGALPVLNEKAVEYAVLAGLAFQCRINSRTKLDRKQYYYPDLPKAYQISQFDVPLCEDGYLEILLDGGYKRVGITRIHIEEDAGKLVYDDVSGQTLADYNRCGVPLIEIVSAPDMRGADEAKAFLEAVAAVLRYLGVSDVKMQEGSLRADVNVSVRPTGQAEHGVRVEMKNVNSFGGVHRAVTFEAKRQADILAAGGSPARETRRWDDAKHYSIPLRTKEDAQDYRFFPDPDLLPFVVPPEMEARLRASVPELPLAKATRFSEQFGLSLDEAVLLAGSRVRADFFESAASCGLCDAKPLANWMLGDVTRLLNERDVSLEETKLAPEHLAGMVAMVADGSISNTAGKSILSVMMDTGSAPEQIAAQRGLSQISDEEALRGIVKTVLEQNELAAENYRNGKQNAIGFLVGRCMKESQGRANPTVLTQMLRAVLERD